MATTVNCPRFDTTLIAAGEAIVLPASETNAAWIKLLPAGSFTCRDGRGPFHAGDSAALQAILTQTEALLAATEMMVDYDHQSIFGAIEGVGGTAKAAGWIKSFEIRDDGIYGQVQWTEAASAAIKAREYRYISPLFAVEKTTSKVIALRNAALVNMPALDLEAIAARFSSSNTQDIPMEKIALALGLAETASEAEILAAIAATQNTHTAIAVAAGLEPIWCVSTRTSTAITGAASYDCGIAGETSKFGGSLGIAEGSSNAGVIGPQAFYSDTAVRLSANGGSFTAGAVKVVLHYMLPVVPQE
ncbi:MAG: phage protease [Roseibium sp.]